jgi:ribosome-binding protein aMBF1 (putative translation factor)
MSKKPDWNQRIRDAVKASGLSVYNLAMTTGLKVAPLQRFMAGRNGLTVKSAQLVGARVGLELVAVKRERKGR